MNFPESMQELHWTAHLTRSVGAEVSALAFGFMAVEVPHPAVKIIGGAGAIAAFGAGVVSGMAAVEGYKEAHPAASTEVA